MSVCKPISLWLVVYSFKPLTYGRTSLSEVHFRCNIMFLTYFSLGKALGINEANNLCSPI